MKPQSQLPCFYCTSLYHTSADQDGTGWWCDACETYNYFNPFYRPQYRAYLESSNTTNDDVLSITIDKPLSKRISPLRYPGGKTRLVDFIASIIRKPYSTNLIAPFVGGGSVEFALLEADYIKYLYINDTDPALYALYHTILHNPQPLITLIETTPITHQLAKTAKSIITQKLYKHLIYPEPQLAFYYLLNNRLSFSGIYNAGPLGGKNGTLSQLTSRYNPKDLIKRINRIHQMKHRITLTNKDALQFLEDTYWIENSTIYMDPPYIKATHVDLYQHNYELEQHYSFITTINNYWLELPHNDILLFYDEDVLNYNIPLTASTHILSRKFSIKHK